ncbi:MAG: prolipoprotein diacylglyceryl transferase [Chloroflexota bacterium]|nr:prolipoprotein diacylglyceryl transferase [Chloroflexota bacterium]
MKPPVDPILIHFTENWGIHWYGLLIVSGVMLGALCAAWRANRNGDDPDHVWNALTITIILGIIGARLYHVFSAPEGGMVGWDYYRTHPIEILYIWQGGLGIYGAIVGGLLGVALYTCRAGLRPLKWLDYGAPGLALGQTVGRWGNFINQELYGPPTNLPWGLRIDPEHRIMPYNNLEQYPPDTLFHPTFLYESLWCLLVFGVLAVVADRFKDRLKEGDILLGYLIGYPLGRFFLEYLRPDAWMIGPLAAAQLFALICVVTAAALLIVRHTVAKAPPPGEEVPEAAPSEPESGESVATPELEAEEQS